MSTPSPATEALKRPATMIAGLVVLALVVAWLFVFFLPQGRKLSTLGAEKASLQQAVVRDNAQLQRLRTESHHVGQIQTMYTGLQGYAPSSEDLYTYIQVLSSAAKTAGVTITSLSPSPMVTVAGTSYSAVPIAATVKGNYDALLALLHSIDHLPRLTDVNSIAISGGGPGTNRGSVLTVNLQLSIFTSQKPTTTAAAP